MIFIAKSQGIWESSFDISVQIVEMADNLSKLENENLQDIKSKHVKIKLINWKNHFKNANMFDEI